MQAHHFGAPLCRINLNNGQQWVALKYFPVAGMVAVVALASSGPAASATVGGSVSVSSDYVLRGVSQTNGNPSLQGEGHWRIAPGWSTGLWAAQVQLLPQRRSAEVGAYLQWHSVISDEFDLSVSATHYAYPSDPRRISYDYDELGVSLAWRDQIYLAASWTPKLNLFSYVDGLASDKQVLTVESSVHRSLLPRWDATAGVGFYHPQNLDYASYAYGNAALAWHYGHWRADLTWFWVQNAHHRQYTLGPAGGPLAATITWSF